MTLNWTAIKTGAVAIAMAYAFSAGYSLKTNIDATRAPVPAAVTQGASAKK